MTEITRDSIGTLFDRYSDMVFRVAFSIVKSREEAEDVVMDTFIALMKQTAFNDDGHIKAWLIRTAENKAINVVRSCRVRRNVPLDEMLENTLTEPPHGYISYSTDWNNGELAMMYKADYSWEYNDRGELTKHEGFDCGYEVDPLQMCQHDRATEPYTVSSDDVAIANFNNGEIVSVTAYTPDGASAALEFDKQTGRISMPEGDDFQIFIVEIAYDTDDYRGWCNYYFFM